MPRDSSYLKGMVQGVIGEGAAAHKEYGRKQYELPEHKRHTKVQPKKKKKVKTDESPTGLGAYGGMPDNTRRSLKRHGLD